MGGNGERENQIEKAKLTLLCRLGEGKASNGDKSFEHVLGPRPDNSTRHTSFLFSLSNQNKLGVRKKPHSMVPSPPGVKAREAKPNKA
jgi:hypothetical protein